MRGVDRWREPAVVGRFGLLHLAALAGFWVAFSWLVVGGLAASYVVRMSDVTAGDHHHFSHRSFTLGRGSQFGRGIARDLRPFVLHARRQTA